MGKAVKANLDKKEMENQEPETVDTNQENAVNEQPAIQGVSIQLVPPKNQEKKGLLDVIWKDRGIFGKTVTVTLGTVTLTGLVIAVKALVALLFGPEAAEMIDPSMVAPTEE